MKYLDSGLPPHLNFEKGKLTFIGGRPGTGKTTLILSALSYFSYRLQSVLFFSMEMDKTDILKRLIGIYLTQKRTRVRGHEISLIAIDDTSGLTPSEIAHRTKKLVKEKNIEYVFIDYYQLIKDNKEKGRKEKILLKLAQKTNAAIVVTFQLHRAIEMRKNKKQHLKDLKKVGIDIAYLGKVFLLHNPTYFNVETLFPNHNLRNDFFIRDCQVDIYERKGKNDKTQRELFGPPDKLMLEFVEPLGIWS